MRLLKLFSLCAGFSLSMAASATDLLQAYRDALVNDAVYASARAQLAAGQEATVQGRAGLLPLIGISGANERVRRDGVPEYSSRGYSLSLSQPLIDPAAWQNYEQGKLQTAVSETAFTFAGQDLILRVAQAYFDVLAAQDTLASLRAQMTAIEEQLASAKRNFEVGTATITDTHEAQARHDLASAQELAARSDLEIKRAALEQLTGNPAGALATLRADAELQPPQPMQMAPWVAQAEEGNLDVISRQLALQIAQRDITRNRAGHYPTVDLVASRSDTRQRNNILDQNGTGPTTSVGVQWSIPLYSGFAVTSRVRQAIALEDKARADLESSRRIAAQSARQAWSGVTSGLAQVKALEAAERSSASALESNRVGYEVGIRINLDVLDAQRQLYATQRDLAVARYDTLVNALRLKSAAGVLQEDDLVRINTLLQAPAAR
ncbi:outer membrane protein [Oxalicibacterium flavum]|uniref:Outer membrane protein n=1 Tax=Oxalicibacterium flavum TaxID=179467 RepID=A0A8J2UPQ9_9BURK|nr:TolC family outer membrane protein [Oxalicibacterium flavum]GGC08542.1 outer membrane protein [Oxalicibacterium flavum]